jgi:hypothetical protein
MTTYFPYLPFDRRPFSRLGLWLGLRFGPGESVWGRGHAILWPARGEPGEPIQPSLDRQAKQVKN